MRRTAPIGSSEGNKRRSKWKEEACGSSSKGDGCRLREGRNRVVNIHPHICQFQRPTRIAVRRQILRFKVTVRPRRRGYLAVPEQNHEDCHESSVVPANRTFMHCSLSSGVLASTTISSWAGASTAGMPPGMVLVNRKHKASTLDLGPSLRVSTTPEFYNWSGCTKDLLSYSALHSPPQSPKPQAKRNVNELLHW